MKQMLKLYFGVAAIVIARRKAMSQVEESESVPGA